MTSKFSSQIRSLAIAVSAAMLVGLFSLTLLAAGFRNAPASAASAANPYADNAQAAAGGKKLFAQNCAQCHGNNLQGMGPAPTLLSSSIKSATGGELFWFITNGELNKGMPGWAQLPKQQRWQLVTFLQMENASK